MLFRPSFCANCGDKIERAEWRIWTSRRFCEVCETEFKGQDLIPRVLTIGGLVLGLVSLGNMFSSSGNGPGARQPRRLVERPLAVTAVPVANVPLPTQPNVPSTQVADAVRETNVENRLANVKRSESLAEPAYYCGAATKKGTPCTRRVKGNVRCYQHVGMPAMVSGDKLKAG